MTADAGSPVNLKKLMASKWPVWLLFLWVILASPFLVFPNRYTPFALFALPILSLLVIARGHFLRNPLNGPLLLFLATVLASAILTLEPARSREKMAGLALGVAVFQAMGSVEPTSRVVRLVPWTLLGGGVAMAAASLVGTSWTPYKFDLLQSVYQWLPTLISQGSESLPRGFHPNEVGGMLTLFLPLSLAFSLRSSGRSLSLAGRLLFVLFAGILTLTQSRSGIIGATVGCLAILFVVSKRVRYAGAAIGLAAGVWLVSTGTEGLISFMAVFDKNVTQFGPLGFAIRLEIWERALYIIRDFPFTGVGLGIFSVLPAVRYPYILSDAGTRSPHAHNILLETTIDFGLGGLLAFLLFLVTLGLMIWRTWAKAENETTRTLALGVGAGLFGHQFYGLADAVNWGAKPGVLIWAFFGAAALAWQAAGRPQLVSFRRITGAPYRVALATVVALIAVGVVTTTVALRGPLLSAAENNLGARELGRSALAKTGGVSAGVELWEQKARGHFEAAVEWDPGNAAALRNLAWTHTASGDYAEAAEVLARATAIGPADLLARYDLARAYSAIGDSGRALPLYRSLLDRFPDNDALMNAEDNERSFEWLRSGVQRLAAGEPLVAAAELRQFLMIHPGDLVAGAYLAKSLIAARNENEAAAISTKLHRFTLGTDGRTYRRYLPGLLPFLVEQGFVESGELSRIAAFLLWQHVDSAAPLVDILLRERPKDVSTWALSAEMHERRGERAAAVADMNKALMLNPGDPDIHYRLGRLLETDQPDAALAAYRQALAIVPAHLSTLQAMSELLSRQGKTEETAKLRQSLTVLTSDRGAVASKLGMAAGDILLVAEPLLDGELPLGSPHPAGWRWENSVGGQEYGLAFYSGGVDEQESYVGERSLRVFGFWAERRPESGSFWLSRSEGKQLPRAGYSAPKVALEGNAVYALSFVYKTKDLWAGNAQATMYVLDQSDGPTDRLANTDGRWKRHSFLVVNRRSGAVTVRPRFTNWGVGDVWFADIRLSRVVARPGMRLPLAGMAEIK